MAGGKVAEEGQRINERGGEKREKMWREGGREREGRGGRR